MTQNAAKRHWQTYQRYFWMMMVLGVMATVGWTLPDAINNQAAAPQATVLKGIRELAYMGTAGMLLVTAMYWGEMLGAKLDRLQGRRQATKGDAAATEETPGAHAVERRIILGIDSTTHRFLAERAAATGDTVEATAERILRESMNDGNNEEARQTQ